MSTTVLERITEFLDHGPFLSPSEARRREIRELQERLHMLEAEYAHTLRQMHLDHQEDRQEILEQFRDLQPSQPRFEYTFMPHTATPSTIASTNEIRDYGTNLLSPEARSILGYDPTEDDLLTFGDFVDGRPTRSRSALRGAPPIPFSSRGHGMIPWYPERE